MDETIKMDETFTSEKEESLMLEANKVFSDLGFNDMERFNYVRFFYKNGWHFSVATIFAKLGYKYKELDIIDELLSKEFTIRQICHMYPPMKSKL